MLSFLRNLPYYLGVNKRKELWIDSWHFWYKQLFHLAGGFIIGIVCVLPVLVLLGGFLLAGVIVSNEVGNIRGRSPYLKSMFDILFWAAGFALGVWL
jgi:hypothetical protein